MAEATMSGGSNIVEIVLRAVDNLSQDFTAMEKRVAAFERRAAAAGVTTDKLAAKTASLRQSISPLVGAISNVTNAIAAANPQLATLISASDNLVLSATRASAATTTWQAGLLAGVRAIFNPYALGILGIVTAVGALVSKWQEAKKAAEDFNQAVKTNNVQFFAEKIIDAQREVETYRQKLEAAEVAQTSFNAAIGDRRRTPAENAQATVLANQVDEAKRALDGAISTVQQYTDAQNNAARAIALKALPALTQQIKLQREAVGANERQKISIEAVNAVNEQLFKGLTQEEIAQYQSEVAKLANAKANDLIKKTNLAAIDSIKSQTAAIDAEIKSLTLGAAAAREFAAAQSIQKTERDTGVRVNRGPITDALKEAEARAKILERTKTALEQERETEEGLRFIRQQSVEDVKALADQEQRRVTGPLQASQIVLESQRDVLNNQLQVLVDQESPLSTILATAKQLDEIERKILSTRIEQQKALIAAMQTRGEDTTIAEAQLKALENSAAIVGQRVAQVMRDAQKEVQSAADSLAKDFVDRFIDLLDTRGKSIGDTLRELLSTTAKTILSQVAQSSLSELLRPQLEQINTDTGKTPKNIGEFLTGQLTSVFKSILGIEQKPQTTEATPLNTAATTLQNVAVGPLSSAATVLQGAGDSLLAAANALMGKGQAAQATGNVYGIPGDLPDEGGTIEEFLRLTNKSGDSLNNMNTTVSDTARAVEILGGGALKTAMALGSVDGRIGGFVIALQGIINQLIQLANSNSGSSGGGGLGGLLGMFGGSSGGSSGGWSQWVGMGLSFIGNLFGGMGGGGGAVASAKGNIFSPTGMIPAAAFASGGIIKGPTLALMGEREPEVVAPFRDTRDIGEFVGVLHRKNGMPR